MRIAVVVTARPSYSRVRSLLFALQRHPDVDLKVIVCASALLERYGKVVDILRADGFQPAAEVYSVIEGENLETSAKSTGLLLLELASVIRRLRPDLGVCHADRHEVLAAAQAFRYQEIPLAHLQGGEQTGSIDDRVRDCITQLADYHLVSTAYAARRVAAMRQGLDSGIWVTGCPSVDACVGLEHEPPVTVQELGGAGAPIDLAQPFLVVLLHPTTDQWQHAHAQMTATLQGCLMTGLQVLALFPGNEAGMDGASKAIREHQERIHTVRNLPPRRFLKLLTQCAVLCGNSSVGLRECSYLGVPVVNIGNRQRNRERGANVVDVSVFDAFPICSAIEHQINAGFYPKSEIYGDGHSGQRMADVLVEVARETSNRIDSGNTVRVVR